MAASWAVAVLLLVRGDEPTVAAGDVHDNLCVRCKPGSLADGGARTDPELGCLYWCSRAGHCGDGLLYRRGLDCRRRNDAAQEAKRQMLGAADDRYDALFLREYGKQTFEQHHRAWDHAERYGPAISIRGERHCGTGWMRVMTSDNCPSIRHYWSPHLDSDGLYGWKHDFLPDDFDARSKDAMIVVFRNAVSWVPKMQRAAYSEAIARISRKSLAAFVSTSFVERGRRYSGLLDLRAQKYRQYLQFAAFPNVLAARYEDLLVDPTFMFAALNKRGLPCKFGADFKYVKGYAKFGATTKAQTSFSSTPNRTWTNTDWNALTTLIDTESESRLGYAYDAAVAGLWRLNDLPADSPLLSKNVSGVRRPTRRHL